MNWIKRLHTAIDKYQENVKNDPFLDQMYMHPITRKRVPDRILEIFDETLKQERERIIQKSIDFLGRERLNVSDIKQNDEILQPITRKKIQHLKIINESISKDYERIRQRLDMVHTASKKHEESLKNQIEIANAEIQKSKETIISIKTNIANLSSSLQMLKQYVSDETIFFQNYKRKLMDIHTRFSIMSRINAEVVLQERIERKQKTLSAQKQRNQVYSECLSKVCNRLRYCGKMQIIDLIEHVSQMKEFSQQAAADAQLKGWSVSQLKFKYKQELKQRESNNRKILNQLKEVEENLHLQIAQAQVQIAMAN